VLPLKEKSDSSQELELTDDHMSFLEGLVSKFQAADSDNREKIVKNATKHIKRIWEEDTAFDKNIMKSVCDLSATLDHSHILLAYLRVSVGKS